MINLKEEIINLRSRLEELEELVETEELENLKPKVKIKRYLEAGISSAKLIYCFLKFKPDMKAKRDDIVSYVGELFTDPTTGIWALEKLGYVVKLIDEADIIWIKLERQLNSDELSNLEKEARRVEKS